MKTRVIIYSSLIGLLLFMVYGRGYWYPLYGYFKGKRSVADVVAEYGQPARTRLLPLFQQANIHYPPNKVTILVMKDSKKMQLWAQDDNKKWQRIHHYEVQASSGHAGPKLREGDGQVPEGIYRIIGMNPNSAYHLSMKLNYPNDFDLYWANIEQRLQPGSNIFIHGKNVSIGCLAMGDTVIEELFILAADTGKSNIRVVISPTDPRLKALHPTTTDPPWVKQLYEHINEAFDPFRIPPQPSTD